MTKTMHPADAADREAIARVEYFNVHLRRNPAEKINEPAATLAEAAGKAEAMTAKGGKPAMIYAVMPEGTSVFVPNDLAETAREAGTEARGSHALSAREVSMLTAEITGGGFKRSNSRDVAVKRFAKILADQIGEEDALARVDAILGAGSFEQAQGMLAGLLKARERGASTSTGASAGVPPVPTVAAKKVDKTKAFQARAMPRGKRAEVQAAAARGELPAKPDFSAPTHARFRKKLDQVVAMAEAGDIEGLRAFEIKPASTSPKAIMRYRDLAITALEARAGKGAK